MAATLCRLIWRAWNRFTPFKIVRVRTDWAGGLHIDAGGLPVKVENVSSVTAEREDGTVVRREVK